jgi:hypothetical protein
MTLKRVNHSTPCPICGRISSCSVDQSNGLVFCIEAREDVDGFVFRKEAGNFGVFAPDSHTKGSFTRTVKEEIAVKKLPYGTHLQDINGLLNSLTLSEAHRQLLLDRGLTDVQIVSLGFRSVTAFQKVNASRVGGVDPVTKQWMSGSGLIIPMFNGRGICHGFSFKPDETSFGKYTWTSYKNKQGNPVTNAKILVNNVQELPLTLYTNSESSDTLYLVDGVLKTILASIKHNIHVLGSQGGTFASSPEQFKAVVTKYNNVYFAADAGDFTNHQVINTISRTAALYKSTVGKELQIVDWDQTLDKSVGDLDEITSFEFRTASLVHLKDVTSTISKSEVPQIVLETVEEILKTPDIRTEKTIENTKPKLVAFTDAVIDLFKPGQAILYNADNHNDLLKLAYDSKYKYIIDTSPAGSGKSHLSGLIKTDNWAVKPNTVWYFSKQHRKPTTNTIEDNFFEHPTKNTRMFASNEKLTPNGNPILLRDKPRGEYQVIAGNCHLAERQMEVYQAKAKVSLCRTCKFAEQCKTEVSEGEYGYLYQLQQMAEDSTGKIRANIQGVNFEKNVQEFDFAIVDEYTQTLEFVDTVTVSKSDFAKGMFDIKQLLEDEIHLLGDIERILLGSVDAGRYGLSKQEFFEKYGTINGLASYYIDAEVLETKINEDLIKSGDTPNLVFWSDLFRAFSGQHTDYSFTISNGSLTIYKKNKDLLDKINTFHTTLFLDATSTPEDLAFYLGVPLEEILVISQEAKTYENVTIAQCVSLGGLGVSRTDESQEKIKVVREVLTRNHGKDVGFIDFKRFAEPGDLHHFVDGRGSNAFQEKTVVCCFGIANTNLGVARATYEAIEETVVGKFNNKDFNKYYALLRRSELEQEIGRLRSIRRKDQALTFFNFSNMDLTYLADRGFKFEQVRAHHLDMRLADNKDVVLESIYFKPSDASTKLLSLPIKVRGSKNEITKEIVKNIKDTPGIIQEALNLYAHKNTKQCPYYSHWKNMIKNITSDFTYAELK